MAHGISHNCDDSVGMDTPGRYVPMNLTIECPSTLRPEAKYAVVLEAPGADEVTEREGLVGGAGKLWNKIISHVGLERTDFSILNVVKRRPPKNDFTTLYEKVEVEHERISTKTGKTLKPKVTKKVQPTNELRAWREILYRELKTIHPRVIFAAGNEALRALCKDDEGVERTGIMKWRGSPLRYGTAVVIPVIHPAAILRGQRENFYVSIKDYQKGVRYAERRCKPRRNQPKLYFEPNLQTVKSVLRDITERWCLDIEIRGDNIACIGIGDTEKAICIPFETTRGPYFRSTKEEEEARDAIGGLLASNPNLVNQNVLFDLDWLADWGLETHGVFMDTMHAFRLAFPELPMGLGFILSFLFDDIIYFKDDGKTWVKKRGTVGTSDEQLWKYNLEGDVVNTLRASYEIEKELKKQKKWTLYESTFRPLIEVAFQMQKRGLRVDMDERRRLSDVIRAESIRVSAELTGRVGDININSSVAVKRLLYETLKLPKQKMNSGAITTNEEALLNLLIMYPNVEELRLIIHKRHLSKCESNYTQVKLREA